MAVWQEPRVPCLRTHGNTSAAATERKLDVLPDISALGWGFGVHLDFLTSCIIGRSFPSPCRVTLEFVEIEIRTRAARRFTGLPCTWANF